MRGLGAAWVFLGVLGLLAGSLAQPARAGEAEPAFIVLTLAERQVLGRQLAAPGARDAVARVAYAEAAGQGDSGLAAVVFTILNRLGSGRWGDSVESVVNARAQFEPVLRAGGDWRALPVVGAAGRSRIEVMVNLALDGRLPDPTGGALYFQNPAIVAARAAAGQVAPRLVNFGGAAPSVVIGDHAFYRAPGGGFRAAPARSSAEAEARIFPDAQAAALAFGGETPSPDSGDRGLIVLPGGRIVEDPVRCEPRP